MNSGIALALCASRLSKPMLERQKYEPLTSHSSYLSARAKTCQPAHKLANLSNNLLNLLS